MSDTNKQSPLGVNALNSYLNATGLTINPAFTGYAGTSHDFPSYTFGSICQDTVLRVLTHAIHEAYVGHTDISGTDGWPTSDVYNNLISIGGGYTSIPITSIVSGIDPGTDNIWFKVTYTTTSSVSVTPNSYVKISGAVPNGYNGNWLVESVGSDSPGTTYFRVAVTANYGPASTPGSFTADTQVPGLGNAKALVYTWEKMIGPYGTGTFNLGDVKGWGGSLYKNNRPLPVTSSAETANPATQWAYIRLLALQAWMEFNYNSTLEQGDDINPAGYRDFVQSFNGAYGFISYSNSAILPVDNSKTFLDGAYSNMNDLISGDITGVSLATKAFGQDIISLGKALNLSTISTFGLPSNLLKTLVQHNALTQNVSLAIIATGINTNELGALITNISPPTVEQEQKLYAAFYITVGDSLTEALIPLNCKTQGLQSLADLLNPKKMFPNSYETLTVPLYNTTLQPTNSKTYYPIYVNSGVNPNLTSPAVLAQIGVQTPVGPPPIKEANTGDIVIQQPTVGFGSYLSTIIPPDIATACGALAASFLQIKNIKNVPIEKFGQVVTNMETIVGLPVNGTNVPTNLNLRTLGRPLIALGSGPQGTYTASDFFGCMSGLPYNGPFKNILAKLKEVATTKLFNIYHELYLAVTYQRARMSISQPTYNVLVQPFIPNPSNPDYQPNPAEPDYDPNPYVNYSSGAPTTDPYYQPRIDNWFYTLTFAVANNGGGYGRGTAPPPNITITPNNVGATASCTIGTNDQKIPGDFGRVNNLSANFGSPYLYTTTSVYQSGPPPTPTPPEETIYIELPPPDTLAVQSNGNRSTSGTNVAPGYGTGSLGTIVTGAAQWPTPMNTNIQQYINQANEEIDVINKRNRLSCQSLNDSWNATGVQLTIEQRARQTGFKPPLADPRENYMSSFPTAIYNFVDATAPYAKNTEPHMYAQTIENISNLQTPGGQSAVASMRQQRNQDRLTLLGIPLDNNIEDKLPYEQQKVLIANGGLPTGTANANIPSGSITTPGNEPSDVITPVATPIQQDPDGNLIVNKPIGVYDPIRDVYLPTDPEFGGQQPPSPLDDGSAFIPDATERVGFINVPGNTILTDTAGVTNGRGTPGSFADSPYINLIPPELNTWYTSNTLYPSTYTVSQAIEEVVLCNCDCWQLA